MTVFRRRREISRRIVDEDIDGADVALDRIEDVLHGGCIADVECGVIGPAANTLDRGDATAPVLCLAAQDADRRTEARKLETEGLAESGAATADSDDPVVERALGEHGGAFRHGRR